MRHDDVSERFTEMLLAAGGDPDDLRPSAAWTAFTRFAAEPIDGLAPESDRDRLLFEAGPTRHGPGREPAVLVELERQYTLIDDEGEHLGMRHLLCTFAYPLAGPAAGRAVELWDTPGTDVGVAEWTERVRATPHFRLLAEEPTSALLVAGAV